MIVPVLAYGDLIPCGISSGLGLTRTSGQPAEILMFRASRNRHLLRRQKLLGFPLPH
jgi:hypothetical protein